MCRNKLNGFVTAASGGMGFGGLLGPEAWSGLTSQASRLSTDRMQAERERLSAAASAFPGATAHAHTHTHTHLHLHQQVAEAVAAMNQNPLLAQQMAAAAAANGTL